jgi:Tfp pilus assembly protein PilN
LKYSFIAARDKKFIGAELKWLLTAFVLLFVLMSGSYLFLNYMIKVYEGELVSLERRSSELRSEHQTVVAEIARLQEVDKLREALETKNRLNKENVKNFFDLVPDGVTLELAEFRGNTLRLKGVTKSKETFSSTFERSLASLFSRTNTKFTKLGDGSYRFNNISLMEVPNE